jgi:hypothetical protein
MNPDNPMEMKATRGTNLKPVGRIDLGQTTAPTTAVQPETQPTMPNIPQPVIPQPIYGPRAFPPVMPQRSLQQEAQPAQPSGGFNDLLPQTPNMQQILGGGGGSANLMQMLKSNPTALKHAQKLAGELMVPTPQTA